MPKAILEFDLNEDQYEFEQAVNASKYRSVLWDLDQYLRKYIKYPAEGVPELLTDTMELVRNELHKLMEENNITLD